MTILGLFLFTGFVVFHAVTSYGWSGQTTPPAGVAVKTVSYTCGAPWGAAYVHGPATTAYRLTGVPCGQRGQYQLITVISGVLGVLGLGAALAWRRPSRLST